MFLHLGEGRCLWFFCCSLCLLLCAASVEESGTGSSIGDRKSVGAELGEDDNEGRPPRGIGSRRHMRKDDADRVASYFLNGGPLVGHSHFVGASRQDCDQNPPEPPGQEPGNFLVGAPHEAAGPPWTSGPGWFPGYHPPIGDIHTLHQNFFRTAALPFHGIAHAHSIFNGLFSPPLVRAPNPTNSTDSSSPNGESRPDNVGAIVGSPNPDQTPPLQDGFPNDLSNTYFHYNNMFGGYHPEPSGYIVRMVPHAPYDPSNEQAAGAPTKGTDKAGDGGSIVGSPKGSKESKPKDPPDEQKRKEKCKSTTEKSSVNSGKEEGAKNNETEKKVVRRYRPQESANNLSKRD